MTQVHARLAPSGAYRWINCPASVTVPPLTPPGTSSYAREGSFAHSVAEKILKDELFFEPLVQEVEGQRFVITPTLLDYLEPYVDLARHHMERADYYGLEAKVQVGKTEITGTADFYAYYKQTQDLYVLDLKYGAGVRVSADTPQTKLYALGVASHLGLHNPNTRVSSIIVQPRISGVDIASESIETLNDLHDWFNAEVLPAVVAIERGITVENPGSWCQFCPRYRECPTRRRGSVLRAFGDTPVGIP